MPPQCFHPRKRSLLLSKGPFIPRALWDDKGLTHCSWARNTIQDKERFHVTHTASAQHEEKGALIRFPKKMWLLQPRLSRALQQVLHLQQELTQSEFEKGPENRKGNHFSTS